MGKTAFSGPVYGAKSLLWAPFVVAASSGATTQTIATTIVPTYEDWYLTEALYACSSCSTGAAAASSVASFVVKDDSSAIHTATFLGSTATPKLVTITADPGEYEGKRVAAGSTITFVVAGGSSAVPMGSIRAEVRGYIRFISSTRAE